MLNLNNKAILITGGTGLLGQAITKALLNNKKILEKISAILEKI